MKNTTRTSLIAVFSILIILAIICSTQFAGLTGAQAVPSYGSGNDGNSGQQATYAGGNAGPAAATGNFLSIPGLESLQGFMPGENQLTFAVIPVSQQNNQLGFQVIGFALSGSGSSQAVVYSLSKPLAGVIDPTQNTLQVDFSNLADSISQAGYIAGDKVYDTIRSGPQVMIIYVDMTYQGAQGTQTIFNVNSVAIIPPDGRMQAFQMQQPTQLIIDSPVRTAVHGRIPADGQRLQQLLRCELLPGTAGRLRAAHNGTGADLRAIPGAVPDLLRLHLVQPVLLPVGLPAVPVPAPASDRAASRQHRISRQAIRPG